MQRALLLGGSCELALGVAGSMIKKGVCPILTHRNPRGKARIIEALQGTAGSYHCVSLDLGQVDSFASLDSVLVRGVDVLVDFAHGDLEGWVASTDPGTVNAYFETHIANRFAVIQKVARTMVARRKGRMVYISSAASGCPNHGQGFYAAAKQAAEAIYRNVALELAARGVTTVTLRPGYIAAGRGRRFIAKQTDAAMAKISLGRALEVEEVVDTIMFLISDSSAGFNATALTMDGGR